MSKNSQLCFVLWQITGCCSFRDFENKSFRIFCHSSLAHLSPPIDVCLELNVYKGLNIWVWRKRASVVKELLSWSVRRSEIVFYVPVKETDWKKSVFLQRKGREAVRKGIFPYICFMSFAYLFYMPHVEQLWLLSSLLLEIHIDTEVSNANASYYPFFSLRQR